MKLHHRLRVAVLEGEFRECVALGKELLVGTSNGVECLINRCEILHMSLREERKRRHLIQEEPQYQGFANTFVGKVFDKKVEAVTEIEKCLVGVILGQSAATNMINHRCGVHLDLVSQILDAPTEINLLHVCKKVAIEALHQMENIATDEHSRASRPKDVSHRVVLPVIFLQIAEDTTAAEGIAVFVDKSATSTCIFEFVTPVEGEQLRLHSRNLLVGIHLLNHRLYPAVDDLNVGIEQAVVLCLNPLKCKVIAECKPFVLLILQQCHLREVFSQESDRVVLRGIVTHHCLRIIGQRAQQRGQKPFQEPFAVPVQNDDR